MKKTILTMAILIASAFSFDLVAQQPETVSAEQTQEQVKSTEGRHKGKKGKHKGDKKAQKRRHPRFDVMDGIELTAEQQEAFRQLDIEKIEKTKSAIAEHNKAIEKIESDYDKKLKKVLTEEQYLRYLKNKESVERRKNGSIRPDMPKLEDKRKSPDTVLLRKRMEKQPTTIKK